jgi:hypothetical protein
MAKSAKARGTDNQSFEFLLAGILWRNAMKALLAVVALSLAAVFATPVVAQMKEPKTKAECQKAKDMKWDDKASKCLKK